ncbi:MAG: trypsin-like serine protease [Pseudomonadota bacterium]
MVNGWTALAVLGAFCLAACTPGADDSSEEVAAGAPISSIPGGLGDDSCEFALNLECDDGRFGGTGTCESGTDATDCRALAQGGTNSCRASFNNRCDEPNIGMGICTSGTDMADCAPMATRRNRTNLCTSALNGICEERALGGNGACAPRTDTIDCLGRSTIPGMRDYHFGYDDRVRVDSDALPWSAIGLLGLRNRQACTATLVSPDVILTAAHCFFSEDGSTTEEGVFLAGLTRDGPAAASLITDVYVSPAFVYEGPTGRGRPGDDNGDDWAFARLAEPLGVSEGYLPILSPSATDRRLAVSGGWYPISQAGYSWDTGEDISAHLGCSIEYFFPESSLLHTCDTTVGDSGSPLLADRGERGFAIVAIGSRIVRQLGLENPSQLAVDARGFAGPLRTYIAGQ